jgi:hypothetical protein
MARNRIIYQSQAVAFKTTGGSQTTIDGVQSVTYGLDVTREDVNQFGDLGAVDRIVLEAPVANAEVSFYIGGVSAGNISGILDNAIKGNTTTLYIALDAQEGEDYDNTNISVVSIVSGNMTSLNAEASVGAIPTMTMGFEGTDLAFDSITTVTQPNTAISFATQSGVVVGLGTDSVTGFHSHVQSATVSFDLGLEGLQKLGAADAPYVYARVPSFPASASLQLESLAINKGMELTLATLKQKASEGSKSSDGGFINVNVNFGGQLFTLVNSTLDSVSFNNSIGDNATASATFSCSIGGPTSVSTLLITP